MEQKEKINKIIENSKLLKLSYSAKNIENYLYENELLNSSLIDFCYDLLQKEVDIRLENGKQNRIRNADFPYKKFLEDLKPEYLPEDARKKLNILRSLNFIKDRQNVVLFGNPGTGKTHIAIGLGIKACMEGYKVLFASVPSLVNKLKEAKNERTLSLLQGKFEKYDLIILDELGYISFDKEGGELLFTYLSLRAERKSTIITTNLSYEKWNDVFHDTVLTAAIVDRITHKAISVNMIGDSYRMKETKEFKF